MDWMNLLQTVGIPFATVFAYHIFVKPTSPTPAPAPVVTPSTPTGTPALPTSLGHGELLALILNAMHTPKPPQIDIISVLQSLLVQAQKPAVVPPTATPTPTNNP